MSTDPQATMVISCSCGARLRVSAGSIGKKAKCPKCQNILPIQAAIKPAAAAPKPAPDAGTALGDLSLFEPAPAGASPPATAACPRCAAPIAAGVRVCTSCGFDLKKGRVLTTALATDSTAKEKAATLAKAAGTFVLGSILSLVGALLGGGVWFLVAWYLNREIGYVALAVGALAGVGMLIGCKTPSMKAGIVAAVMSAVGIIAAKATIFVVVLYSLITGNSGKIEVQREYVILHVVEQILADKGVTSDAEREKQWDAAHAEAESRVKKMSDAEVREKWAEYRAADTAAAEEEQEEAESPPDGAGKSAAASLLKGFILANFGLFDLLWFFLALGTAYKIGNGGLHKEE